MALQVTTRSCSGGQGDLGAEICKGHRSTKAPWEAISYHQQRAWLCTQVGNRPFTP